LEVPIVRPERNDDAPALGASEKRPERMFDDRSPRDP
jgi:hypothetical protein